MTWLEAFVWTLALELPVYTLCLRRAFRPWWGPVALTLAVNVTHPLLWLLLPLSDPEHRALAVGEGLVALVEASLVTLALVRFGSPRPTLRAALARGLGAAILANAVSFGTGVLVLARFT